MDIKGVVHVSTSQEGRDKAFKLHSKFGEVDGEFITISGYRYRFEVMDDRINGLSSHTWIVDELK